MINNSHRHPVWQQYGCSGGLLKSIQIKTTTFNTIQIYTGYCH
jgi:hypothetical protein